MKEMCRLMGKPTICICENEGADQLRGNREADQRLCFRAKRVVQSLYFLNAKFHASSCFLLLHRPVCVGPVRKPLCCVFPRGGSNVPAVRIDHGSGSLPVRHSTGQAIAFTSGKHVLEKYTRLNPTSTSKTGVCYFSYFCSKT